MVNRPCDGHDKSWPYANFLCNQYGIDSITMGATIACAMELYELGAIPESNIGFPLRFGGAAAVVRRTELTCKGDPLEIYTNKEGGVIFKKYSLLGGLSEFAGQMCETLSKTTGEIAVITDRDTCIAVAGTARRELADKRVSAELEQIMEGGRSTSTRPGTPPCPCARRGINI